MAGRRGGRIYLTEKQADKVIDFLKNGHFVTHALKQVGIPMSTYAVWKKRYENLLTGSEYVRVPKKEKEKIIRFFERIREAQSNNLDFHVKNLRKAAEKNPKWSAWYLEKAYPEEYGEKKSVEVKGEMDVNFSMKAAMDAWQKKKVK